MLPKSIFLAASFICVTALPVVAQPIEVSTLEHDNARNVTFSKASAAPDYITDVLGRKIRMVGPRFYPDSARALEFPGRTSSLDTFGVDADLSQR